MTLATAIFDDAGFRAERPAWAGRFQYRYLGNGMNQSRCSIRGSRAEQLESFQPIRTATAEIIIILLLPLFYRFIVICHHNI